MKNTPKILVVCIVAGVVAYFLMGVEGRPEHVRVYASAFIGLVIGVLVWLLKYRSRD